MKTTLSLALLLLTACTGAACTGDKSIASNDSGGGSGADSGTDSGHDSGVDSGHDSGTDSGTDSGNDSGNDSGIVDTGTITLHGHYPDVAIAAPDFDATNRDGTARGKSDLMHNPTVMWFYPAAGTSG